MCFYVKLPYNIGNIVSWAVKVAGIAAIEQLEEMDPRAQERVPSSQLPAPSSHLPVPNPQGNQAKLPGGRGKSNLLIWVTVPPSRHHLLPVATQIPAICQLWDISNGSN